MKVGLFDPYLDSLGGGEKYILTAAKCLASNRNDVSIFWDQSQEKVIKEGARKRFSVELDGIKFVPNIFDKNTSLLNRLLISRNYDAIIYLSDGSIPFLLTKTIIHFQFPVEWVNKTFITKLKMYKINNIICNSLFTKKFIDNKFQTNSQVIYPPATNYKNDSKKQNIILTVGRYNKIKTGVSFKKHEVLIEVFKKMYDQGLRNWDFHLVISFQDRDKEEINKLNNSAKDYPIKILENVLDKELKEEYCKSRIYWHASGFGEDLDKYPEYAEHFGISTVEAMSAGCVPVVIKAGGQLEIVQEEENGFLWSSKDELMEKTKKVIENRMLFEKLSEKAVEKASFFSPENFCKNINALIK